MSFQILNKLLVASCIVWVIPGSDLLAQSGLEGFFSKNSAETPFIGRADVTTAPDLVMLRSKDEKPEVEAGEQPAPEPDVAVPQKEEDRHFTQPGTPEEIVKQYGEPGVPYPVAATDDAPGPFKAMYAAMNAGDDELAFKYAVQYVKFREQLKEQNKKAVSIMGQAQRKAGLLPAGSWPDSGANAEYAYLQDVEVPGIDDVAEEAAKAKINVTEETRQLVAKLRERQYDLFNDDTVKIKKDIKNWEDQERKATREEFEGKLPVSASGEIDILVFLKLSQDESIELGTELQKLVGNIKNNKKANLAAFALGTLSPTAVKSYQLVTKTNFAILPGGAVAKSMGLSTTPAIIFVTREGESHMEVGLQNYFRLDEIRKIMQGEKL